MSAAPSSAAAAVLVPIASPHDPRLYRIHTLSNGLTSMIITDKKKAGGASEGAAPPAASKRAKGPSSDASSKPAVVALSVRVGHWSDPAAIPGLAHFLEHMLFMGTALHPGENSWEDYLAGHGGSSNAFTDSEATTFYFEVHRSYLKEALERFAGFFICPLFAASATRREINAVDSEFRDGFNSDSERLSELLNYTASLVRPTHPFSKWGWGNKDSLDTHLRAAAAKAKPAVKGKPTPSKVAAAAKASGAAIDLRANLKAFHARWYSAHAMKLVVYDAAGDAAEIAQWIDSGYSAIKNNGLPLQDFSKEGNPFEAQVGSATAAVNGAGAGAGSSKAAKKAAKGAAASPSPSPALPLSCYRKIHHVVPIKDSYKLSLSWVLPPMQAHFRAKPTHYAEHLIGHEGSGSLFSLLRDEGWATSLCAGVSEGGNSKNTSLDLMQVSITLTKLGAASVPRVIDACFQYLALIRQPSNIHESIWLELQSLSALAFLFAESPDPSEFVQEAAMNLQVMPPEEVLRGQFLHERFDRELTVLVLNALRVDNCRIDLLSPNTKALAASMQQPLLKAAWFHTAYFEEPLTQEMMDGWSRYDREPQSIDKRLHLPKKNEFVPTDFEIRKEPAAAAGAASSAAVAAAVASASSSELVPKHAGPTRICPSLRGEYWHNLDSQFDLPRAHVHLLLSSPVVYASASSVALTELLLKVLVDYLSEYAYAASLAELEFSVESLRSGIEFKFAGFSHRIAAFVSRVVGALGEGPHGLDAFLSSDEAATRFEGLRDKTHRYFKHHYFQPAKQVEHLRLMMLQQHKFSIEDITEAAKQCTVPQLAAHIRAIRMNMHITGLVDGNLLRSEGEALVSSIEASILPASAATPPPRDELTLRLPVGHAMYVESRARNARESNSALEAYWALAPARIDLKAALSMLESLMHEPAFDHLRSQLQLGYKVYTGQRNTHGILGFVCGIQSADFNPPHLNERIHHFMFSVFYPYLIRMTEDKYRAAREALIAELLYADSALIERVDREWEEITENRSYCWQRSAVLAAQVATVTLAQVTQLFEHYFLGITAEAPLLAPVGTTSSSSTGAAKDESVSMTDVESAAASPLARENSDALTAVAQLALSPDDKKAAKPAPASSSKRSSRKGGAAAPSASPSPPPVDPALEALVASRVQSALRAPVLYRRHLVVACFGHPRKGRNQREEEEDEDEEEDDEEGDDGDEDEEGSDDGGSDDGSEDGDDSDADGAPAGDSASAAPDSLWFAPDEWSALAASHAAARENAEGSKQPPSKKQRNGRTKQTDMSRSKQAEAAAAAAAAAATIHASPPAIALPPLQSDGMSVACKCAAASSSSSSSSASSTPAASDAAVSAHPAALQCEHDVHVRSLAALASIKAGSEFYPFSGGPEPDLPAWACEQRSTSN